MAVDWSHLTMGGPVGPLMPRTAWNGVAVVGEVPGSQEVIHGEAFTGPTGRVLDKIMRKVGVDRDATLITNTFRMQPVWTVGEEGKRKPNDTGIYFTEDPGQANLRLPTFRNKRLKVGPDEDVRELWRLLRRTKPRVVVACGAVALWALTGEDGIGRNVGEWLDTGATPCRVMATWHPAHAIHKDDENIAVEIANCFKKALEESEAVLADIVAKEAAMSEGVGS